MIIKIWNTNETVVYAAEELQKYVNKMDPGFCQAVVIEDTVRAEKTEGEIKLGEQVQ